MNLDLTEDQNLFRDTAARFISERCPLEKVRELSDSVEGVESEYLAAAGELGWFSMLVREDEGGGSVSGEGVRDAAIIAELRGRTLQPGPFGPMNVVAAALSRLGSLDQQHGPLAGIVGGSTVATWIVANCVGDLVPGDGVMAVRHHDSWRLNGMGAVVQDAARADVLLVSCASAEGSVQFLVDARATGVDIDRLSSLDITQRFARVDLHDVDVANSAMVGTPDPTDEDVELLFRLALVLNVVETVGALDALFEMTRQYALDRVAFGRPIGAFQAVKHQLADMSLSLEAAKAIANAAVAATQLSQGDADMIASMAKSWTGDAGISIAQGCFQIFAGIGFTWEHDSHLYVRRVTMNATLLGDSAWHRERICQLGGLAK